MPWERDERGGVTFRHDPTKTIELWRRALAVSGTREYAQACPRCQMAMILRVADPQMAVLCESDPQHGKEKP